MSGRRSGTRGSALRREVGSVLTRAFDRGQELRVLSPASSRPSDRPSREDARDGSRLPPPSSYDVPRSAWPVPTRPATPALPVRGAQGPTNREGPGEGAPSRPRLGLRDGAGRENGSGQRHREEPSPAAPADATSQPQGGRAPEDVEADIAAILSLGRGGAGSGAAAAPADDPGPGVPPGRNKQAIFDQIAASMSRARSYDLGSVELEQRFDDFDRLQDAGTPPARTRSRTTTLARRAVPAGPAGGLPAPSEVIEDLDAIRSRAQSDEIPLDPGIGGRSITIDVLEPGDIILSTTSHPLSEQIRAATGSEVSHAAVYVGNGRLVEAIEGGVILRSVETAVEDDTLAVAYRHRDMTPAKAAVMVPFLENHARRRTAFDHWGLIQVAPGQLARAICNRLDGPARQACLANAGQLKVGTNDENTFFCSELVLEAFTLAGLSMSELEPSWSSPGQIAELRSNGLLDYVGHLKA